MFKAYKYRLYPNKEQQEYLQNVLDVYDSSIIVCFQIRLNITKNKTEIK